MPILVANGTTQQIAEHIAERLAAARHQAEARPVSPTGDRPGYGALGYRSLRTRAPRSLARSVAVSPGIAAPMIVQSLLREVEG